MAGTTAPAGAGDLMNDAFSPHTYQLLYRCRGGFSSPTTFGEKVLKIDWVFKLGLAGGVAVSRAARDPILATPTTRGAGSKDRSYIYLISFDPYRTPVCCGVLNSG